MLLQYPSVLEFEGGIENVLVVVAVYALRMFWFAWNQSTPDTETNLAGWKTFDYRYYANYGFVNDTDPCYGQQWRGLVCARQKINETASNAQIIGL